MAAQPYQKGYLALGSNMGDRATFLALARLHLESMGVEIVASSRLYETPPWGPVEQSPFLNQVLEIRTRLTPLQLLATGREAEIRAGRLRREQYGPRTLDVDVLSVEDIVSDLPELTLPHPRVATRAFVLVPWAEIAPQYFIPRIGKTVAKALADLPEAERSVIQPWLSYVESSIEE
jgi:2-amino-4-hydroxy-6-hydroxymethyldihydropteridine diphosphokinase